MILDTFFVVNFMVYLIDQSAVVYTRWGKKRCPSNAEMVYSGKNKITITWPVVDILLLLYSKFLMSNYFSNVL